MTTALIQHNEILVPKGSIARQVYFVVKGSLRIFLTTYNDQKSTRFIVFEGHFGTHTILSEATAEARKSNPAYFADDASAGRYRVHLQTTRLAIWLFHRHLE